MKTYGLHPGKPNSLVGRVDHKLEKKKLQSVLNVQIEEKWCCDRK